MQYQSRKKGSAIKLKPPASRLPPKKSLGQHFLQPSAHVRAVAEAGEIAPGGRVLEIGPGRGVLTRELLARGARVIAVEKDRRLLPELQETFAREVATGRLKLIEADVLMLSPGAYGLTPGSYKLIANIPYYITGALLQKFLGEAPRPSLMVFLVQKEVAERIARSKKESVLSLSVKAYGTPRYVKTVPRGAFSPAPKVDSAILKIADISTKRFADAAHEKRFFRLLHAGFAHKRKLLARNLEPVLGKIYSQILKNLRIDARARAEDVPLERWVDLSRTDII